MKMQYPEIVDVAMPAEGIFQNLMIVAIRKSYPGHARKIMNAIWSLGQAMFTKVVLVVDHDVNVQNSREVVWKALCAIDPERDIQFVLGPWTRLTMRRAARISARRWALTPRANGRKKDSPAMARRNQDGRRDQKRAWTVLWNRTQTRKNGSATRVNTSFLRKIRLICCIMRQSRTS